MNDSSKTFHRWTADEDKRLRDAVTQDRAAFDSIGQPGGVARDLFWGQIPGRIGVLATPLACQMRYRTLTSETSWAQKRRKGDASPATKRDPIDRLAAEVADLRAAVERLTKLWAA